VRDVQSQWSRRAFEVGGFGCFGLLFAGGLVMVVIATVGSLRGDPNWRALLGQGFMVAFSGLFFAPLCGFFCGCAAILAEFFLKTTLCRTGGQGAGIALDESDELADDASDDDSAEEDSVDVDPTDCQGQGGFCSAE
jgi:hypothetical protein